MEADECVVLRNVRGDRAMLLSASSPNSRPFINPPKFRQTARTSRASQVQSFQECRRSPICKIQSSGEGRNTRKALTVCAITSQTAYVQGLWKIGEPFWDESSTAFIKLLHGLKVLLSMRSIRVITSAKHSGRRSAICS